MIPWTFVRSLGEREKSDLVVRSRQSDIPNIMFPAPMKTTLKLSVPGIWETLGVRSECCEYVEVEIAYLSMGTSLAGSMEGRREAAPELRWSEPRLEAGRDIGRA